MDNSFNTLIRSLRDNYIEYKITGSNTHKQSYESAEQGIEKILSDLESSVHGEESKIADFFKDNPYEKIDSLQTLHSTLQKENDNLTAATLRQSQTAQGPVVPNLLPQYIAVGVLGGVTLLLSFL